jgi:hypothetical protein
LFFRREREGLRVAKYIFITGGVVSSLGKGITAASLGRLLKSRGLKVALQKFWQIFAATARYLPKRLEPR